MEQTTMQAFEEMTKKLIEQVMAENDLSAISPEMVCEIRECVLALHH
ncbi:MAG: hypothetical protein J6N51_05020 [Selenomonas sp.]|nr:hypothetical protein [Selenomonas sp.]